MVKDDHLHKLRECTIKGWSQSKNEVPHEVRSYWTFRDDMAMIDGIILNDRLNITPKELQKQVLDQFHSNHMGIKKRWLLAHESTYWIGINANNETDRKTVKHECYVLFITKITFVL